MSLTKLGKIMGEIFSAPDIQYTRWDFNDTKVVLGAPSFPLDALDFIVADHVAPQAKRFQCLTGGGVFASNANQAGFVEIGVAQWAITNGNFQLVDLTGIPFPIIIEDISSSGTSSVKCSACRQTKKPAWRREAIPGVYTYRFETPRMIVSHGIHLPFIVT